MTTVTLPMVEQQGQRVFEVDRYIYRGSALRVVMQNGEPWFVAKDACEVLELGNVTRSIDRLDNDEKGLTIVNTPGGPQEMSIINEPGLYSLIFTSRKPEAKDFKRWVTHEVLPSIRKNGMYTAKLELDERQVRTQLLKAALEHEERIEHIEDRIELVERKVDEQITLDSGEQRSLQKAIARKVYDIESDSSNRRNLFRQLHCEIRNRWAVPSYRDVRRTELEQVLKYVDAWHPVAVGV